jgi:hypothetical protein
VVVDDPDLKLGHACYIVRDANGHALAYVDAALGARPGIIRS